jgi:hypothetical protein
LVLSTSTCHSKTGNKKPIHFRSSKQNFIKGRVDRGTTFFAHCLVLGM